jgi:hypothetical protein
MLGASGRVQVGRGPTPTPYGASQHAQHALELGERTRQTDEFGRALALDCLGSRLLCNRRVFRVRIVLERLCRLAAWRTLCGISFGALLCSTACQADPSFGALESGEVDAGERVDRDDDGRETKPVNLRPAAASSRRRTPLEPIRGGRPPLMGARAVQSVPAARSVSRVDWEELAPTMPTVSAMFAPQASVSRDAWGRLVKRTPSATRSVAPAPSFRT